MSLNIFWFLPTHGDGITLAPPKAPAPSTTAICNRSRKRRIAWVSAVC